MIVENVYCFLGGFNNRNPYALKKVNIVVNILTEDFFLVRLGDGAVSVTL